MRRVGAVLSVVLLLVLIGARGAPVGAQVAVVDDAKEKDDPATCADGFGRSFTLADAHRYDGSAGSGSEAFWAAHASCYGETSGATDVALLGAVCSDEADIVLPASTSGTGPAGGPDLDGWVVCVASITAVGSEPVTVRVEDFELQRNSAGTVAPSEEIAPFVPEAIALDEPRQVRPDDNALFLLAFDVEEGWADGDLLLRWWETADEIIVDRTDDVPLRLLAGDPDAMQRAPEERGGNAAALAASTSRSTAAEPARAETALPDGVPEGATDTPLGEEADDAGSFPDVFDLDRDRPDADPASSTAPAGT